MLRGALEALAGEVGGYYRVHVNRDDTVDAEYRQRVTTGDPEPELAAIEDLFPLVDPMWLSIGWLYSLESGKPGTPPVLFRGQPGTFTHPRLGRYKGDVFDGARAIQERLAESPTIKFAEIVVRLRWSADGQRPRWHTRSPAKLE